MNQEQKQNEQTKSSVVWAVIFFVLIVIVVIWVYFIRLSFVRIDEEVNTKEVLSNEEAISTIEEAVKNFGAVLEQADKQEQEQKNLKTDNGKQKTESNENKEVNLDEVAKSVADKIEGETNKE